MRRANNGVDFRSRVTGAGADSLARCMLPRAITRGLVRFVQVAHFPEVVRPLEASRNATKGSRAASLRHFRISMNFNLSLWRPFGPFEAQAVGPNPRRRGSVTAASTAESPFGQLHLHRCSGDLRAPGPGDGSALRRHSGVIQSALGSHPYNRQRLAFTSGTRIGPYEILSALGAGGMGEVYRARDTKLDRDVAIKVLPDAFATDPERLARFSAKRRRWPR